jgi:hypothetical protein
MTQIKRIIKDKISANPRLNDSVGQVSNPCYPCSFLCNLNSFLVKKIPRLLNRGMLLY